MTTDSCSYIHGKIERINDETYITNYWICGGNEYFCEYDTDNCFPYTEIHMGVVMKLPSTRSNDLKDFDDLSDTIDEFYDGDKLNSDIAGDVYHKISTNIDLRHLRCFSMKEITEQVECFSADMIEVDKLRKEG